MYKKLMMACMAVAAFAAFVLPSAASASPALTHENKLVPVPTKIAATLETGTIAKFTSAAGTVECNAATLTGTLKENTGSHIGGEIESAKFTHTSHGEDCTSWLGTIKATPTVSSAAPWCVTSVKGTDNFTLRGGNCPGAAGPIKFTLDFTSGPICGYEKTTAVQGTFTTGNPTTLKIEKQGFGLVHNNSFLCPSEGSLDMSFTLYTDDTGSHVGPLAIS